MAGSRRFNPNYPTMKEWCKQYYKESVGWLHMLLAKEKEDIIVRIQALVHECLHCWEFHQWCKDKHYLIKFLSSNEDINDWEQFGEIEGWIQDEE